MSTVERTKPERKKPVNDLLVMAGIFAAWILLQTVILPKLGVST
jgi:hypothetical protein